MAGILVRLKSALHRRIHNWISNLRDTNNHFRLQRSLIQMKFVGSNTMIGSKAIFTGYLHNIYIGNNVMIEDGAELICDSPDAQIYIGDDTIIKSKAMLVTHGGKITFGNNCSVNPYCILYGNGNLNIGNYVRIGAHTLMMPANHIFTNPDIPIKKQGVSKLGINIGNDVWVGGGVRIVDGCTINQGSIIGAGAVVTKSFPEYSILAGVPAKIIGSRRN